jgi:hypothetical protein
MAAAGCCDSRAQAFENLSPATATADLESGLQTHRSVTVSDGNSSSKTIDERIFAHDPTILRYLIGQDRNGIHTRCLL